ncbi:MAG: hypothetical protein JXA20_07085 [Spirochaetes bacterium]|nr:hypothetical protein [Spirochaetota bacterium]
MKRIVITCGTLALEATLGDTPTAAALYDALPLGGSANRWGDELYFQVPYGMPLEPDAREILEPGELAYWPVGRALCIFFGPTPASADERPRAYSPVNVFGRITGDPGVLRRIPQGTEITVRKDELVTGG